MSAKFFCNSLLYIGAVVTVSYTARVLNQWWSYKKVLHEIQQDERSLDVDFDDDIRQYVKDDTSRPGEVKIPGKFRKRVACLVAAEIKAEYGYLERTDINVAFVRKAIVSRLNREHVRKCNQPRLINECLAYCFVVTPTDSHWARYTAANHWRNSWLQWLGLRAKPIAA